MNAISNKSRTATGTTTTYTYAGAAQNAVLSEATPGSDTYNITYGGNDNQGQPEIVMYNDVSASSNLTGNVFSDPTTGQATLLTASSGTACIYVYDGLDNPVGLLTRFATNAATSDFDPYGVGTLDGTGVGSAQNPYAFHSGIQDRASGLVKFGIRWYNPTTGTWTQQDTLDAPLDPANANRYVFVGGDPINGVDPTGRLSCTTDLIADGLAVGLLGASILATAGASAFIVSVAAGSAVSAVIAEVGVAEDCLGL